MPAVPAFWAPTLVAADSSSSAVEGGYSEPELLSLRAAPGTARLASASPSALFPAPAAAPFSAPSLLLHGMSLLGCGCQSQRWTHTWLLLLRHRWVTPALLPLRQVDDLVLHLVHQGRRCRRCSTWAFRLPQGSNRGSIQSASVLLARRSQRRPFYKRNLPSAPSQSGQPLLG